jgi:hypothetical protein
MYIYHRYTTLQGFLQPTICKQNSTNRARFTMIYDLKVRISQIGIEAIAIKAYLALSRYMTMRLVWDTS